MTLVLGLSWCISGLEQSDGDDERVGRAHPNHRQIEQPVIYRVDVEGGRALVSCFGVWGWCGPSFVSHGGKFFFFKKAPWLGSRLGKHRRGGCCSFFVLASKICRGRRRLSRAVASSVVASPTPLSFQGRGTSHVSAIRRVCDGRCVIEFLWSSQHWQWFALASLLRLPRLTKQVPDLGLRLYLSSTRAYPSPRPT